MKTEKHFRENADTFEGLFKHLVDTKVDDYIHTKTKQMKAGMTVNDL